ALQATLIAIRKVISRIIGAVDETRLFQPVHRLLYRLGLRLAIVRQAKDAADGKAGRNHQLVVLGNEKVLQDRHTAEQADVLEGTRDLGMLRDFEVGHALEQERRAFIAPAPLVV